MSSTYTAAKIFGERGTDWIKSLSWVTQRMDQTTFLGRQLKVVFNTLDFWLYPIYFIYKNYR